ncbi:MAG: hypothetical protein ABIJ18_04330 [archaeon]
MAQPDFHAYILDEFDSNPITIVQLQNAIFPQGYSGLDGGQFTHNGRRLNPIFNSAIRNKETDKFEGFYSLHHCDILLVVPGTKLETLVSEFLK